MRCSKCGTENAPGATFCVRCGLSLAGAGSPKKGMAIASLILGLLGLPTAGIVGIGALLAIIFGIIAVSRANREPQTYGGKGLAIGGIVTGAFSLLVIPVILIFAAIAIPSLLRARVSANESIAIGDIRAVISSEVVYASSNGGYFDTLECLARPQQCIPKYQENMPTFLDSELARATIKSGYRRSFHAGPAPSDLDFTRVSPSSMTEFAYVAEPFQDGRTGIRAFCGDSTGVVCETTHGGMPPIVDGRCPPADVCVPSR